MGLFSNLSFLKRGAAEAAAEPVAVVPAPPALSSEQQAQAEALVQRVVQELPEFIAVAVVDSASGHLLAGQWAEPSAGAAEVAAANAAIVQQTRLAMEALHLGPDELLEDMLITLRQQLHLLRVLPASGWLLCLVMRTQDTNLALARAVLRSQSELVVA